MEGSVGIPCLVVYRICENSFTRARLRGSVAIRKMGEENGSPCPDPTSILKTELFCLLTSTLCKSYQGKIGYGLDSNLRQAKSSKGLFDCSVRNFIKGLFYVQRYGIYEFIDLLCEKNYWGQRKNFFYSACISEDFSDNWIFIEQYSKWQLNEVCEKSCKYILRCCVPSVKLQSH